MPGRAARLAHHRGPPPSTWSAGWPAHYDDTTIAASWPASTAAPPPAWRSPGNRVADLRHAHGIPAAEPARMSAQPATMMLVVSITQAAQILGVGRPTLYRWLRDGFITGEQLTPGAPWRIRIDQALRDKIRPEAPDGWLPLDSRRQALGGRPADRVAQGPARRTAAVHVSRGAARPAYPGQTRSAWTYSRNHEGTEPQCKAQALGVETPLSGV